MANRPWIVASQALVAEFFGVSVQTVKQWRQDGMPGRPGAWDLAAILRWRDARRKNPATRSVETADGSDLSHRRRLAETTHEEALAALAGRKNERDAGELIPRSEAKRDLLQLVHLVRTRLETLPDELEMEFPAETREQNKASVGAHVHATLLQMARGEFLDDATVGETLLKMASDYRATQNGEASG